MTLAAGVRLGPYEVGELLGAGGMAEVYRAHDPRLRRDVAIKVVLTDGAPDAGRLRRFEDEARAVAALSHPNVLTVFDVGASGGRPYLVLELLEGESLRQRLERGVVPLRQAVEIAIGVCRGLEAAHARGVVHCDLKPENVFLTADGRVKILDFGIAQLTRSNGTDPVDDDTKPGLVMGTLSYLSPEIARGLSPDGRADLFSLGAVLYEMLAGRRAFPGSTAADTIAAVLHGDPSPARTAFGPVPAVLDRLVRRCLHKDPAERFHSAHDLALALEAVLDRPLPGAGGPDEGGEGEPYPGLSSFTEADAGRFFGRESEVSGAVEPAAAPAAARGDRPLGGGEDVLRPRRHRRRAAHGLGGDRVHARPRADAGAGAGAGAAPGRRPRGAAPARALRGRRGRARPSRPLAPGLRGDRGHRGPVRGALHVEPA